MGPTGLFARFRCFLNHLCLLLIQIQRRVKLRHHFRVAGNTKPSLLNFHLEFGWVVTKFANLNIRIFAKG